ncbi:DMT family transporter [Caenimonas aquaedulcis]|uniref:DMT family transporter n=1 Tax=Caenimonas aquaedulcis TaxID=2793270 RepID=A0A931MG92_9BURK|nr:DMT family transporter [Caenimonas aquaedulcis]
MLAVVLVVIWGSNYSIQKGLLALLGPSGVVAARYVITALCALFILLWRHGLSWPRLERREWMVLTGLAFVGHVLHVTVMANAMNLSTPFSSALISACGPIFTLLIVRFTSAVRLDRVQQLGVGLALAGILVFLSDKLQATAAGTLGDLLLLVATLLFACHTVAARALIARRGVLVVMTYATLIATLPMLALHLPGAWAAPWRTLSLDGWMALAWSLIVASFGGWLVWGWLNHELGVPRTAPLLYLLPPVAGLIAWATLGETFSAWKILGALMALGGVALAQFSRPNWKSRTP